MDLNVNSPKVWEFYDKTLKTLAGYGAKIIRLDAFAYASKVPGKRNFLNEPETWQLLDRVRSLADKYDLTLLPEIHASYGEGTYRTISEKGYMTYDFFLPGLILDAFERKSGIYLKQWADEVIENNIRTVNMLGCHDGIPLLDLKGLLPEEDIEALIETLKSRGGFVKDLHGAKNIYYQVSSTYLSALGGDEKRLCAARAIQIFMPGKPQVWYLDLLNGLNDYEAVRIAGEGGHKEINRTNITLEDANKRLHSKTVQKQLELLRMRNTHPAFSDGAQISVTAGQSILTITWRNGVYEVGLNVNFENGDYSVNDYSVNT